MAYSVLGTFGKLKITQWMPLIDKIISRITSWTAKKLTYAGRLQLIKSVLFGVQSYWAHLFVMPAKVIKLLESHCRSYLWSGTGTITRRALVAWERICRPKSAGGLGLMNLKIWNIAAITRICWDLARKADKLWIKWIYAYYIKGKNIQEITIPGQASWMVRKIMEARQTLQYTDGYSSSTASVIRYSYMKMIGQHQRPEWKNLMFNNNARPRAMITMWLQVQNRLMTKDRLATWGRIEEEDCVMCGVARETRDHLFHECIYARNVWKKIVGRLQIQQPMHTSWLDFQRWIQGETKGRQQKAKLLKVAYTEYIHQVWKERNCRIFERRETEWERLAQHIAYIVCLRAQEREQKLLVQLLIQ